MSRWRVTAIERLSAPDVAWPSVFGPLPGADPVAANSLHTVDLTPHLVPLGDFTTQMERDLTTSSFSSIKIDLEDADGSLAGSLGPFSAVGMAATNRYFGPWIQVIETWSTSSTAVRFLGYIDETSIQWSEDDHRTQFTVIHASQLLRERLITDYPSLLRPWPSVPTNASQSFAQSTADDLLQAAQAGYTVRGAKNTIEAALWAVGALSWQVGMMSRLTWRTIYHVDYDGPTTYMGIDYEPPAAAAASIVIGSTAYAVDHIEWDTTLAYTVNAGNSLNGSQIVYGVARIVLQGTPNLTGLLHLADTVTWGIPESQRTHYLLNGATISAPASGSDGAKFIQLNTVEQLVPGDVLTLTFSDAISGAQRTTTADLPPIIDMDGETGKVYLATALSQGYTNVSKVRRNSQDPVLFDGLAYTRALCAPFAVDASAFAAAPTDLPVLVWLPYDMATPSLYGVHLVQTTSQAGALRAARRGADNGLAAYPTAGVWAGSIGGVWSWLGAPTTDATHQIFGDVLQWPGGTNAYTAPVIYTEGDLSAGAATPPNGWRHAWRSWKDLSHLSQDPESTWNGTAIVWASTTASGDIPAKVVAFAASTSSPGRYSRTSAGVWTFQAHTADATLGSSSTPTITGIYPTGNTLALGMGIYASGDEQEALLALVATGSSYPFTAMTACLLSQASGGNLTVRQSPALWSTGAIPAGPWALGGGLVVQTWTETINGIAYPHTKLHKLNGSTVITADLKTLEVIPQTIQPLLKIGTTGAQVLGGWYALALETFADVNYAPSRRLCFVHLDASLNVINGDLQPDPSTPTSLATYFSRGEVVASLVPDGALIAKLMRSSNTLDAMVGLVGGRLLSIGSTLPVTVERLKIGATVPQGHTLDVSYSGDGMAAAEYLEKFAAAQLASAVPSADGSMRLVSRSGGTVQTRTVGAQHISVQATERGKKTKTQVWQGYLRMVRVTYADLLAGATAKVVVSGSFQGGRILELDMSDLVCSATMARALGSAAVRWFSQPSPILSELWCDRAGGLAGTSDPVFWAIWQVGDRVILDLYTPGAMVTAWKLLKLQPGLENRSVNVELRQQPFQIVGP